MGACRSLYKSRTFGWQVKGKVLGKSNLGGLDHGKIKITKALTITAHNHPMWIWHLPHTATRGLKPHRHMLSRRSQWSEAGWPSGIWQWSNGINPGRKGPQGKGWESAWTVERQGDTQEGKTLLCPHVTRPDGWAWLKVRAQDHLWENHLRCL